MINIHLSPSMKLLSGLLAIIWILWAWQTYLYLRQLYVVRSTMTMPEILVGKMTNEAFSTSRSLRTDELLFKMAYSFFYTVLQTFVIVSLLSLVWMLSTHLTRLCGYENSEIHISVAFVAIVLTLSTFLSLPFEIYEILVIKNRYSSEKETLGSYLEGKLGSWLLQLLQAFFFVPIVVHIVRLGGRYFFVLLWLIFTVITVTLLSLTVNSFSSGEPLEENELKVAVQNLTSRVGFPISKIYVATGTAMSYKFDSLEEVCKSYEYSSSFSSGAGQFKYNAYYYWFLGDEGIVISKSLLNILSNDEVLGVVAHELGHWKNGHPKMSLLYVQVFIFIIFALSGRLLHLDIIYTAFKFDVAVKPIIVGLIIIFAFLFIPLYFLFTVFDILLTRYHEYAADAFAVNLGYGDNLRNALIKLFTIVPSFPVSDWLYSIFKEDHPALMDRLAQIPQ